MLAEYDKRKDSDLPLDVCLKKAVKPRFCNTSPMDLGNLGETQILDNHHLPLADYPNQWIILNVNNFKIGS